MNNIGNAIFGIGFINRDNNFVFNNQGGRDSRVSKPIRFRRTTSKVNLKNKYISQKLHRARSRATQRRLPSGIGPGGSNGPTTRPANVGVSFRTQNLD